MTRLLMMLTAPVLVGGLIAGCASSQRAVSAPVSRASSTPSASLTAPDLTGTWSGHDGSQGRVAPVALRLVQTGATLEGNVYVSERPDLSGPVKGTVEGNTVRLTLGDGFGQSSALQVSADGNQISGNMVGSPLILTRSK